VQKWKVPCNWKFIAENFAGDRQLAVTAYPEGHGVLYSVCPNKKKRTEYAMSPITSEYYQACWERRLARE
jgi:hypothetical protein